MTALRKYQRLQCDGLWRESPQAQRREVVVSFGEASLVISDVRSGTPLAHWSLPAVRRHNPGTMPAVFAPDAEAGETLEIDDPDMIGALETVARALRSGRRARPRVRRALGLSVMLVAAVAVVAWLPGALVAHAVRVLPQAKQAEIGAAILADLAVAGHVGCGAPLGLRALGRLQERLAPGLGPGVVRLAVLAEAEGRPPLPPALALPGGVLVLGQGMIESLDSAELAAAHALAAAAAAEADDPLAAALRAAGLRAVAVLLTTGETPARALRGHGAARLAAPPDAPPAVLADRLAAAGVAAGGVPTAGDGGPVRPVLADADWVSLQGICQR